MATLGSRIAASSAEELSLKLARIVCTTTDLAASFAPPPCDKEKNPHYVPPANITLEELQRFFIVRLEERQGKLL
jgi:hypothetical protein